MRLFRRRKSSPVNAGELISRAKEIEPVVEHLCTSLIRTYRSLLLANEITYIVPAVWGASPDGPLSPEQRAINAKVVEAVQKVAAIIDLKETTPSQEYAVGYLVRGLIIAKMAYQVEGLRYHLLCNMDAAGQDGHPLQDIETMGNA